MTQKAAAATKKAVRPDLDAELNNLAMSKEAQPLFDAVKAHINENVAPITEEFFRLGEGRKDRWSWAPGQLELLEGAKNKAKASGLWNFFLPHSEIGRGLTNLDYAYIAAELGKYALASESLNCSAPDTGNMEVLEKVGTPEQKEKWLKPLLNGEIRSAYAMTEPGVASSDATNMEATARLDGDEVVINGRKWWSTGAGHPDAKVGIFMGLTDESAPRHQQHSMVAVPLDAPGVKVERLLTAMGVYDEPIGHGEVTLTDVRLPAEAIIAGPGRAFEIAQGRLGPGRVHHCMRLIGLAEYALELACERSVRRVAFGKPIANLGGNRERLAKARIAINQARLHVLHAAWKLDTYGTAGSLSEVSEIKAAVPQMACDVIDLAIQLHGGAGMGPDFPLATAYAGARSLRLADGPDEVHLGVVARHLLKPYAAAAAAEAGAR